MLLALVAILAAPPPMDGSGPRGTQAPTRPSTAWELLAHIQHAAPSAVEAVLADPAVGAWAFQLLRRLNYGDATTSGDAPGWAGPTLLGALTAAAALRAGMRATLRIPARKGQLWLPSLGLTGSVSRGAWAVVTMECGPQGAAVFGDSGSIRLPGDLAHAAEGWFPLPRIVREGPSGPGAVVLDHLGPYRDFRAVTDPVQLSGQELRRWQALLSESDELLRREHAGAHRLVTGVIRTVVPVPGPSELRAISATAPDSYGAVTMSLPVDAQAMAATLIHEARHQLLSTVAALTPLHVSVREGPQPVYFAPWRGDPRPLRGLLYGAHAFVGVTSFWQARRPHDGDRAEFEFALHRWQLQAALAALANATGLTRAGGLVVAGLMKEARRMAAAPVPGPPGRAASMCCRDLRATWRATHLDVDTEEAAALADDWLAGRPPPLTLPAARLRTHRTGVPRASGSGQARMWLARLRFTDRRAFDEVRTQIADGALHPLGIRDATIADAHLIAGAKDDALDEYRRQPVTIPSWIGIGLAAGDQSVSLLLERPELVLALQTALAHLGVTTPVPEELAAWLDSRSPVPDGPPSDAEKIDIAVGPDSVEGVPGGLVIGTQLPAE
ncbi:HEXXH motif-containing putative peptide modification protein [Streptomyces phaeochromogenes]|uniref:aKG-HExxH-type peptide beta-hydroxylase n=1 Tax=Streptomyces phaeochromogenes TaxID=1923 RepID=UPI00367F032D